MENNDKKEYRGHTHDDSSGAQNFVDTADSSNSQKLTLQPYEYEHHLPPSYSQSQYAGNYDNQHLAFDNPAQDFHHDTNKYPNEMPMHQPMGQHQLAFDNPAQDFHHDTNKYPNAMPMHQPMGQHQFQQPWYSNQYHNNQVIVHQPATVTAPPPHVPNYLALSIVGYLFCWILGIFAIVNASKANSLRDQGRYQEGIDRAKTARSCSIASIVIGLIVTGAVVGINVWRIQNTTYTTYTYG